eukprot:1196082-Prorocentrum_minimum.AAC.6
MTPSQKVTPSPHWRMILSSLSLYPALSVPIYATRTYIIRSFFPFYNFAFFHLLPAPACSANKKAPKLLAISSYTARLKGTTCESAEPRNQIGLVVSIYNRPLRGVPQGPQLLSVGRLTDHPPIRAGSKEWTTNMASMDLRASAAICSKVQGRQGGDKVANRENKLGPALAYMRAEKTLEYSARV